ncbi:hypothetical protein GCM10027514_06690 [Azotobacter armeniacus]
MHKQIAVDLAKSVYQVAESVLAGQVSQRRRLKREAFRRHIQEQAKQVEWLMEACGTAHYSDCVKTWQSAERMRTMPISQDTGIGPLQKLSATRLLGGSGRFMLHRHDFRHHFDRTLEVGAFARPDVQPVGNSIQLFRGVDRQVRARGRVLANQAIDVLVASGLCG